VEPDNTEIEGPTRPSQLFHVTRQTAFSLTQNPANNNLKSIRTAAGNNANSNNNK